ncbi:MAG: transposase [Caulobacteraceae bacterium]
MKKFTVEQKLSAIKDYEEGVRVAEICRKHNINPNTFYKCKVKYDKLGVEGLAPKVINTISSKEAELRRENEELKKLLGEKELAI